MIERVVALPKLSETFGIKRLASNVKLSLMSCKSIERLIELFMLTSEADRSIKGLFRSGR